MKGYLLDSSICIAMFRGDRNVGAMLNKVGKEQCFITQIVVAELLFGAYRSKQVEKNLKQTYDFIKDVKMLPFANSGNFCQGAGAVVGCGQTHRGLRPADRLRCQGCRPDDGDSQREALQPY